MQEGKIEIPQTLSQQSPLETTLENTRQLICLNIFQNKQFFLNFYFREDFKPPENLLDTLAS